MNKRGFLETADIILLKYSIIAIVVILVGFFVIAMIIGNVSDDESIKVKNEFELAFSSVSALDDYETTKKLLDNFGKRKKYQIAGTYIDDNYYDLFNKTRTNDNREIFASYGEYIKGSEIDEFNVLTKQLGTGNVEWIRVEGKKEILIRDKKNIISTEIIMPVYNGTLKLVTEYGNYLTKEQKKNLGIN